MTDNGGAAMTMGSSQGTWTEEPESVSHQWYRCDPDGSNCRPIDGATAATYDLGVEDAGHVIRHEILGAVTDADDGPSSA
jgi:hypothetical protein